MQNQRIFLGVCAVALLAVTTEGTYAQTPQYQDTLRVEYDNSTNSLGYSINYQPTASYPEVGDQIVLGVGVPSNPIEGATSIQSRLDSFLFQYTLTGSVDNNDTAVIRFYNNDGQFGKPGSLVFTSPAFAVGATSPAGSTISLDLSQANVIVNNDFTWSVTFNNINPGELVTLPLYSPPTAGNNFTDYWKRNSTNDWVLATAQDVNGNPIDASFAAVVNGYPIYSQIPEPTTLALGGLSLALLGGEALRRRRNGRR